MSWELHLVFILLIFAVSFFLRRRFKSSTLPYFRTGIEVRQFFEKMRKQGKTGSGRSRRRLNIMPAKENKSSDSGSNPGERSYFYLEYDPQLAFSKPHRTWLNRKELMGDYRPEEGLLKFSSAPILKFERKGRTGAVPDADTMGGFCWLINDRVKSIFNQVDAEGFVYCKVELDLSDFPEPCPDLWLAHFVRELNCIDHGRSLSFYNQDEPRKYGKFSSLVMVPELMQNTHAFRLERTMEDTWFVDDFLVDALVSEKVSGLVYDPIKKLDPKKILAGLARLRADQIVQLAEDFAKETNRQG